ncbi:MAG: hypothetical protein HYY06_07205, partial [Deltaproteobacteria bacterium]|nr:hypothetical protein [Deltaproteobacteria bacterium]
MTPCPEGWREKVDPDIAALVTCDPWPEGGQQSCAEDEAHFPGGPGCERIGPPCPDGEWPAEIPADARVLYVRAGEPEGGDGTRERPFGWISEAVADASDGDVIALSKGLFDEEVRIDRAVTLLGACVLETRIAPSETGAQPAALTLRAATVVRNLQVGGAGPGIDALETNGTAELDSVLVREATKVGVNVGSRATIDAMELAIRETASGLIEPRLEAGVGLDASGGAQVRLERAAIERSIRRGVRARDEGTALAAAGLVVADTQYGWGVAALGGAQVTLRRTVVEVERGQVIGVGVEDQGTALMAENLVLSGDGLSASGGARVTLDRSEVAGCEAVGVWALGEGTVLTAADLVISDTLPQESDGTFGVGLSVTAAALVTLERAVLER